MTYTIYCKFDKYKWVATCPDAQKPFVMRYPHGSARQAADDVALQLMGLSLSNPPYRPKLVRKSTKVYELVVPDISTATEARCEHCRHYDIEPFATTCDGRVRAKEEVDRGVCILEASGRSVVLRDSHCEHFSMR